MSATAAVVVLTSLT